MRRIHMYVGLFLTPWLAMYALSTVVFNHYSLFDRLYSGRLSRFEKERDLPYTRTFPPDTSLRSRGEQMLADFQDTGSFGIHEAEGKIIIDRRNPLGPRRYTFDPDTGRVMIEHQPYRTASLLTMLHTQVSYANKLLRVKTWAFTVDLTVFTMILLVFTGVWMWWDLKVTRAWGAGFLLFGVALFGVFLKFA